MYPIRAAYRNAAVHIRAGSPLDGLAPFPEQASALAFREGNPGRLHEVCSAEQRLLVLPVRIELTTSPLPRECSTELFSRIKDCLSRPPRFDLVCSGVSGAKPGRSFSADPIAPADRPASSPAPARWSGRRRGAGTAVVPIRWPAGELISRTGNPADRRKHRVRIAASDRSPARAHAGAGRRQTNPRRRKRSRSLRAAPGRPVSPRAPAIALPVRPSPGLDPRLPRSRARAGAGPVGADRSWRRRISGQ
jgi:hypothetical protein